MTSPQPKPETMAGNNAIWDRLYQDYQKGTNIPGVKFPNEHLVRFAAAHAPKDGKRLRAVELGFGNITNMTMLSSFGFDVFGLEVSRESVERAERAIQERALGHTLSVAPFTGSILPLPDSSTDVIIGLQCVYYNLDQKKFAEECARVLKPGGKILFSFFSPRHGYMRFIKGEPGGIVKFTDQHPNARLHGLELFLFRSKEQLQEIYGPHFDLKIGVDEFDTEPLFMSWTYVAGQKKEGAQNLNYPIASAAPTISAAGEVPLNLMKYAQSNHALWEKKYAARYDQSPNPGSQYPNEHLIRFLANKNRGELSGFYKNLGNEDRVFGYGEKVLEIMPENCTNLLMADFFRHQPSAVTSSELMAAQSNAFMKSKKIDSIHVHALQRDAFPVANESYSLVMSEKVGSHWLDQKKLVHEVARSTKPGARIFIGYLSPRHSYFEWSRPLGGGYHQITEKHPDSSMVGMVLFAGEKEVLKKLWEPFFQVEIKCTEFNMHHYFSSFYFVKGIKS